MRRNNHTRAWTTTEYQLVGNRVREAKESGQKAAMGTWVAMGRQLGRTQKAVGIVASLMRTGKIDYQGNPTATYKNDRAEYAKRRNGGAIRSGNTVPKPNGRQYALIDRRYLSAPFDSLDELVAHINKRGVDMARVAPVSTIRMELRPVE